MSTKYSKEGTEELKRIGDDLIERYFSRDLSSINIFYVWGLEEKIDRNGSIVYGETVKANKFSKDIFDYDFVIIIYKNQWELLTERQKEKLMFHELCHCGVKKHDDGRIKTDEEGNPKTYLVNHDLVLNRFERELSHYGLDEDEKDILEFLKDANENYLTKNRDF